MNNNRKTAVRDKRLFISRDEFLKVFPMNEILSLPDMTPAKAVHVFDTPCSLSRFLALADRLGFEKAKGLLV